MSKPLLTNTPTVQLDVGADRRLRANAVLSPSASNALKARSDGLYLKRGRRRYGWTITTPPLTQTGSLAVQTPQVVYWATEQLDAGDLFNVVTSPTKLTFPEAGRWFTKVSLGATLTGGTSDGATAVLTLVRNGTDVVCGAGAQTITPANTGTAANAHGYVNVAAGDYFEVYWRWLELFVLTATASSFYGVWSGFRVSE